MIPIQIDDNSSIRFWDKVLIDSPDRCWNWDAYKTIRGYGRITIGYNQLAAHRVSWVIHYGDIPDETCVLHVCDNPSCVNPKHLFLGTHADNMHDMKNKGRAVGHIGENHPRTKLKASEIIEIRKVYDTNKNKYGLTKRLSKAYNIPKGTMSKIVCRNTWKHLI